MSTLFNQTLGSSWAAIQDQPAAVPTAAILVAAVALYPILLGANRKETDVHELGGFSLLTAWPFFNRRYDFLRSNFAKTGEKLFSFKVLQHSIVAMKGEGARKVFFEDRSLDFLEGYKILMGGAPRLSDLKASMGQPEDVSWFNKHLIALFHRERVAEVLPSLFDDIQARMEGWGREGRLDPFKNVYDLVFQMTVRMATCRELATDIEVVNKLQKDYWTLEKSATPTALLLPWFPSRAKKNKEAATKSLYTTLYDYVEKRKTSIPSSDAIDFLLARGVTTDDTIGFILGAIFAGVINTGINSCWTLLFLSVHKEWKEKVIAEVKSIIEQHTNTTSSEPLHKRLAAVPVSVWEDEMPTFDLVLRETLRLTLNGAALRRNIIDDLDVSGKKVKAGAFVAYSLADIHLNPNIYTNPREFDPTRFLPGREEDKKEAHGFVGWGAGRHPCTGMRVAKLEIKIIVALFLSGYEYDIVDSDGNPSTHLPDPDYNDIQQTRPLGDPCYIKFKRIVD